MTVILDSPPYRLIAEPTTPAIPGRRQSFTDPNFGTTLVRLTDATDGAWCRLSYGIWAFWNCTYTMMLVQCYQADGSAPFKIVCWNPATMDGWGDIQLPSNFQGADAIWSHADPNLIYHRDGGSRLMCLNLLTWDDAVILDAAKDFPASPNLARMSATADDRTFCFSRQDANYQWAGFCIYRDGVLIYREPPSRTGTYFKVQIDQGGKFMWDVSGDPLSAYWDLTLPNAQKPLTNPGTGHSAMLVGALAQYDPYTNQDMLRRGGNPVGQVATIQWPDWTLATEYSGTDLTEPWYAVTTGTLVPVGPLHDEVLQVSTDGSGDVRRFCHMHNVMVNGDYNSIPQPACGYGAKPWIAFHSSWGNTGRRDVFLVNTGSTPAPAVVQSPAQTFRPTMVKTGEFVGNRA